MNRPLTKPSTLNVCQIPAFINNQGRQMCTDWRCAALRYNEKNLPSQKLLYAYRLTKHHTRISWGQTENLSTRPQDTLHLPGRNEIIPFARSLRKEIYEGTGRWFFEHYYGPEIVVYAIHLPTSHDLRRFIPTKPTVQLTHNRHTKTKGHRIAHTETFRRTPENLIKESNR